MNVAIVPLPLTLAWAIVAHGGESPISIVTSAGMRVCYIAMTIWNSAKTACSKCSIP